METVMGVSDGRQMRKKASNDSRTVLEVVMYFHMLWFSLQQVILAMALIIWLLRPFPAFYGVAVLLILIQLRSFLIGHMRIIPELATSRTNERVNVVPAVIKSIKIVELYA